jgi:hypothetical protein
MAREDKSRVEKMKNTLTVCPGVCLGGMAGQCPRGRLDATRGSLHRGTTGSTASDASTGVHTHTWTTVMSTHFYSCRHLLGLQVQRFVEQQQVSLKWITQGLSNSGRLEVKAIPLKQPCNYDTESLLCPQHTQYACHTYRCTSSAKR